MKYLSLLIATVLSTLIVIFSVRNPVVIVVDLLLVKVETSLSFALLGFGLLGMIVGGYLAAVFVRRPSAREAGAKKAQ